MSLKMKYNDEKSSVTFTAEVADKLLRQHYNKACQKYARRLEIPGFRQGKVPTEVVEERLGTELLQEEAINSLLPTVIRQIIDEKGEELTFVGRPEVTEISKKEPLTLQIVMALMPKAALPDYDSLKVEKSEDAEDTEVDDSEVDAIVDNLLKSQGKWERTNAPLQMGFLATISTTGTVDGAPIVDFKKREILLTPDARWPILGFHDQLVGLYRGGQKEFKLTVPDDFGVPDSAGKTATFSVTLHSASEQALPAADDAFAASLRQPGISTLAELRETIAKNLRHRKTSEREKEQNENLLEQLLELSDFHISEVLLRQEKQDVLSSHKKELEAQKSSWEDYLKQSGKSEEQIDAEVGETVLKSMKRRLVFQALIDKEQPELNDAHVKMALAEMRRDPRFRNVKNVSGLEQRIRSEMQEQKALESAKAAVEQLLYPEKTE